MTRNRYPDSLFHDPIYPFKPAYLDEKIFESRVGPENEDLAELYVKRGEMKLLQGDIGGARLFEVASRLAPRSAKLFYQQGLSLFEFGSRKGKEKNLLKANRKFKSAVTLDPHHFDSYQAWGNSLYLLGKTTGEHHYYIKAREKYSKALEYADQIKDDEKRADLYWDHGLVWLKLAEKSEEALDFHVAVEAFEKATSLCDKLQEEFWQDFGMSCLMLGKRLNDVNYYLKSIDCFKHAVSLSLSSFESWMSLAEGLCDLYQFTYDEDHFTQANECLTTAADLNPKSQHLWLTWAQLLREAGKRFNDARRLSSAIDKCKKAAAFSRDDPIILSIWADCLAAIGALEEKLDLIHEGQNIVTEVLEDWDDLPDAWLAFGSVLFSLGHYFGDLDYYFQAIERFQEGLSIDRTRHDLWHALAMAYAVCGKNMESSEDLERAMRFYKRAISLQATSLYHYDLACAASKMGEITGAEETVEEAIFHFEKAFALQKNALYLHPDWYYEYAIALDQLADSLDEEELYHKALEILTHVLMIDPEFPSIHYRLALTLSHLGDCTGQDEPFLRALHHIRIADKRDGENEAILLDWALICINFAQQLSAGDNAPLYYQMAEQKLIQAAKLGHSFAYYYLGSLYSLLGDLDKAMHYIEKADQLKTLPSFDEIQNDEWLDALHKTDRFQNFLLRLENRIKLQQGEP